MNSYLYDEDYEYEKYMMIKKHKYKKQILEQIYTENESYDELYSCFDYDSDLDLDSNLDSENEPNYRHRKISGFELCVECDNTTLYDNELCSNCYFKSCISCKKRLPPYMKENGICKSSECELFALKKAIDENIIYKDVQKVITNYLFFD